MGKKVYVECELEWTKLREEDRDMGPRDGSDMANNFDAKQGIYVVNCVIDEAAKNKMVEGEYLPWDWDTDGLVGNGSKATVKFDVWDGKITTMEKVCITEHLKYEANDDGEAF